jgi:hypothetical protein
LYGESGSFDGHDFEFEFDFDLMVVVDDESALKSG